MHTVVSVVFHSPCSMRSLNFIFVINVDWFNQINSGPFLVRELVTCRNVKALFRDIVTVGQKRNFVQYILNV